MFTYLTNYIIETLLLVTEYTFLAFLLLNGQHVKQSLHPHNKLSNNILINHLDFAQVSVCKYFHLSTYGSFFLQYKSCSSGNSRTEMTRSREHRNVLCVK